MSGRKQISDCMIDCVYVTASTLDARLTRICVSSVRAFYPHIDIQLLIGGPLQLGLETELKKYWGVAAANIPRANYGWGFVKLEPLFLPFRSRFLILDSDTAITGPVLESIGSLQSDFIVDNEEYASDAISLRYYDWRKVRDVDSKAQPPRFVFNTGQWVGTSGVLTRRDFDPWVEWRFPRRLRRPNCFFPGEQGVLNYVLVQKAMLEGLDVERRPIMRWPGYGLEAHIVDGIRSGAAKPIIIHWAGVKKIRHSDMVGADILVYFEDLYYRHLPLGQVRRRWAAIKNAMTHAMSGLWVRARLLVRKHFWKLLGTWVWPATSSRQ